MIQEFILRFESNQIDSFRIKHIQYNIQKRLNLLKYIKYTKMHITFCVNDVEDAQINWDDTRRVEIKYCLEGKLTEDLSEHENIVGIYRNTIAALNLVWEKNNWVNSDLNKLLNEVEADNYLSYGVYGKAKISPSKKYKAEFFLEMFPDYSNYYIQFKGNGKDKLRRIMFLKGLADPFTFFGFFRTALWKDNNYFFLKDVNNEITYVFDINRESYSIEYKPSINSIDQLHNYVRAFQSDIPISEMYRLLGLPNLAC